MNRHFSAKLMQPNSSSNPQSLHFQPNGQSNHLNGAAVFSIRPTIKILRSRLIRRALSALLFFFSSFGILDERASAQQTLFNVPSVDVLDRGKVYFELDAPFRLEEPRFSSFVPRIVIGAGHNIETGLNVTGNIQPGIDMTTFVPTVKWRPYQDEKSGWSFVVGDDFYVPVKNRAYSAGNYAYAEFGKSFKTRTRLTFGAYHFTRHVVAGAQRAGGQFGFEQIVTKKFSVQADWYTGKHASGYFTPGGVYKFTSKVTGYFGYSLGNQNLTHGNNFFYGELGINFN